ncbi:unnamed protein product [Parnassius apollo]|uniref:(apollo) hypothetical protein n=1 Tax=Parnassius apollo TaxID=110799 RepID=A0A8S3XRB2_PARAO|nr:unnamed protein product [Parnassius apollo]
MQFTQAESTVFTRAGVEDIKTQSASKPEIMKKFIKSKIDHNETTSRGSPTILAEPPPNVGRERAMPDVQPPLPLDPPPPDEKPNLTLELKQEIEDIEYQNPGEESSETLNPEGVTAELNGAEETDGNKPKPMCRDFIRGRCTRPGTCKFSHKCDVSQLVGVYTFCRNFQNCVCTLPNCKYVHATVFEEQHFYRTGELPPHALAHHKKVNILPPPPPPPPPEEAPLTFDNPPPPVPPPTASVVRPSSIIGVATTERSNDDQSFRSCVNIARSSSLKRDWTQIGCAARVLEASGHVP